MIYIYILYILFLEHMLCYFSTTMTIAPQQSVGQVGSWKQAPWWRRHVAYRIPGFPRSVGLFTKMVPSSFQWFLLGGKKLYFPRITDQPLNPELRFPFTFQQKDSGQVDIVFFSLGCRNQDLFASLTSRFLDVTVGFCGFLVLMV